MDKKQDGEQETKRLASRALHVLHQFLYLPAKELVITLCKARENNLRLLIFIQFACYILYLFSLEFSDLLYLYMIKAVFLKF